jgi:uncharacterized protein
MLKLIVILVLGYLIYRSLKPKALKGPPNRPSMGGRYNDRIDDVMEQDPVCGVFVARSSGVQLQNGGKTLYFCSAACRDAYLSTHPSKEGSK